MEEKKKIAIFHDYFMYRGGGERLITLMAKSLDADLISTFFDKGSLDPKEVGFSGKVIPITRSEFVFFDKKVGSKPGKKGVIGGLIYVVLKGLRHFSLKYMLFFRTGVLKDYDIVIFSGHCLSAIRNCKKGVQIYYYCHTPPRYLFDQREAYIAKIPKIIRWMYYFFCKIFADLYKNEFSKPNKIISNSKTIYERIIKHLGRDSVIIYPPVDISFFKPSDIRGDYYFSWARLTEIKRVDKIAEAFMQLPDKKLIISHGKNDPEKTRISKMIKGYSNISMIESPTDDELQKLISESIATIFIPINEDFGMTPVESLACGVPVIGVNDGGPREIIIDGKTGILIDEEVKVENLVEIIKDFDLEKSLSMRDACVERAKDFSLETFERKIREEVLG